MDEAPVHPEVEIVDQRHPIDGTPGSARTADVNVAEPSNGEIAGEPGEQTPLESVERPAKVMRIGTMLKQLLDEVRVAPLDDAGRTRLKDIYETSVRELASTLSPDLASELGRMTLSFDSDTPSDAELRIAQAQIVGWLEGLFHGIQAALFAQQMQARSQLEEIRQRMLPPGSSEVVGEQRGLGAPAARQGYL
jgi:Protein of unknown function (DUF2587)